MTKDVDKRKLPNGTDASNIHYKFTSSCHWSDASITVDYRAFMYNTGPETSINWSSGGLNTGFTPAEYADAQAALFKWAKQICKRHEK